MDDIEGAGESGKVAGGGNHFVIGLDGLPVGMKTDDDAKFVRPPCGQFNCAVDQQFLQLKIMRLTRRLLHIHKSCEPYSE